MFYSALYAQITYLTSRDPVLATFDSAAPDFLSRQY